MLPKLAEIFGTTTDALLGRQSETVHEATIDSREENDDAAGIHIKKGNWQFHYENGRRGGIFFALLILAVGVLTLLSETLHWDVSFWAILWPTALLVFGLNGLTEKFSFFSIGCTFFGGYFLLNNLNVIPFDLGDLIWPAIVILFGLSLLADALRKPKKPKFEFVRNGVKDHTPVTNFQQGDSSFDIEVCFGEANYPITLPLLSKGEIECNFGNLTVDLSDCMAVEPNCRIEADCNFGELRLRIPGKFLIQPDQSTFCASVEVEGQPDANTAGTITLEADCNFGQITIEYI
jgi:predicted membrane protein